MSPLEQLLGLTARQHGCASYAQARASGLTAAQIRHRVASGLLERHGDHVLRVGGSPRTWKQDLMAGLLDLGDGALVSRRAAAALHGFDRFPPAAVEFTVDRRRRGRRCSWTVHTAESLDPIDRAAVDGLACTSAARTVIDLARTEGPIMLERAIDSAVRDGLASPTFLRRRLEALRGPGRAGVRLLDALLDDAGGHSPLERAFLSLVRRAGLPRPTCQRIFRRGGETIARVDFSFEPAPILVEVSGRQGHRSDAEQAKDARRRNELQALGFVVLDFTYDDVIHRPNYVVDMLRRAGL
jgi:very-short-patch-repair endonuclease